MPILPVRGRTADAVLAFLALDATLVLLAADGFGTPGPTARSLDLLGVALATLSAVPLVLRDKAIGFAVSAAASLALLHLGYPLDAPVTTSVAAYALALAFTGAPKLPRTLALIAVNAFVPAVAVAYATVGVDPAGIATELLAWAAVFAGLWVAGDRTRLRALRLAEAEHNARRARADAERDRRLAAADERTRIARDLHDSAGHAINVILVQAGAARLLHDRDPERAKAALSTIETVARDTVTDIDRMVRALRDQDQSHGQGRGGGGGSGGGGRGRGGGGGIGGADDVPADPGALGELIERHRASGLIIDAELPERGAPLPRSVAWAAYRILQEALTNAARHGAGRAEVAVRFGGDRVEIDVINPTAPRPRRQRAGLGIVGMRERATLLGGTLLAESGDDRFRLSAVLPHA